MEQEGARMMEQGGGNIGGQDDQGDHPDQAIGDRLYQLGRERAARQERRRQSAPQECTFRPHLPSTPRRAMEGSSTTRCFDRLYNHAKSMQSRAQMIEAEKVAAEQREQELASPLSTPRTSRNVTAESASSRLYDDAKQARARKEKLAANLRAGECPFKPQIKHDGLAPKLRDDAERHDVPFMSRNLQYRQKVEEKVAALRREQEAAEGATFTPRLIARPATPKRDRAAKGSPSVFDYLARSGTRSKETTPSADPNCTFKPSLPSRSRSTPRHARRSSTGAHTPLAEGSEHREPLFERLYHDSRAKEERLKQKKQEVDKETILKECLFSPQLHHKAPTPRSTPVAGVPEPTRVSPQSVFNRLYTESKLHEDRMKQHVESQLDEEKKNNTFKPRIIHHHKVDKENVARAANAEKTVSHDNANNDSADDTPSADDKSSDANRARPAFMERLKAEVLARTQRGGDFGKHREQLHDPRSPKLTPQKKHPNLASPVKSTPIRAVPLPAAAAAGGGGSGGNREVAAAATEQPGTPAAHRENQEAVSEDGLSGSVDTPGTSNDTVPPHGEPVQPAAEPRLQVA